MLNFSEWQGGSKPGENSGLVGAKVMSGKMPPAQYLLAHPEARLSQDERKKLADGITATFNPKQ